jgi:hypothetical protein
MSVRERGLAPRSPRQARVENEVETFITWSPRRRRRPRGPGTSPHARRGGLPGARRGAAPRRESARRRSARTRRWLGATAGAGPRVARRTSLSWGAEGQREQWRGRRGRLRERRPSAEHGRGGAEGEMLKVDCGGLSGPCATRHSPSFPGERGAAGRRRTVALCSARGNRESFARAPRLHRDFQTTYRAQSCSPHTTAHRDTRPVHYSPRARTSAHPRLSSPCDEPSRAPKNVVFAPSPTRLRPHSQAPVHRACGQLRDRWCGFAGGFHRPAAVRREPRAPSRRAERGSKGVLPPSANVTRSFPIPTPCPAGDSPSPAASLALASGGSVGAASPASAYDFLVSGA